MSLSFSPQGRLRTATQIRLIFFFLSRVKKENRQSKIKKVIEECTRKQCAQKPRGENNKKRRSADDLILFEFVLCLRNVATTECYPGQSTRQSLQSAHSRAGTSLLLFLFVLLDGPAYCSQAESTTTTICEVKLKDMSLRGTERKKGEKNERVKKKNADAALEQETNNTCG